MSDSLRHVCCPLCGEDSPRLLHRARSTGAAESRSATFNCTSPFLGEHGPIVRCTACGMVYADPQPDPAALAAAYRMVRDPEYQIQKRGRQLTFAEHLRGLGRFVQPPAELLDVGCYTGIFLELAAVEGFRVCGLELSAWAAAEARALAIGKVHEVELDDLELAPGSLDVITMWDVIEHLPDPRGAVARALALLRPGGVLALSTHLLDSVAGRLLRGRYPFLMDMHLVHFTRPTLRRLLHDGGFELVRLEGHRRCVMLDYLLGRVERLLPASRPLLAPLAARAFARRRPVWVRGLGLANAYAVKRTAP